MLAELMLGQPLFPGESGVDQLVEIIKVGGRGGEGPEWVQRGACQPARCGAIMCEWRLCERHMIPGGTGVCSCGQRPSGGSNTPMRRGVRSIHGLPACSKA